MRWSNVTRTRIAKAKAVEKLDLGQQKDEIVVWIYVE